MKKDCCIFSRCIDVHVGCFGNFKIEDLICKKHCAINIRCAIEQDQNIQMEIMDDFFMPDQILFRTQ